jgi:Asp-tRNA(Asn)/Glu-tRNA(Gln) amidotransferase A subunit family amidase
MRIGYLTRTGRLDDSVAEAYSASVSALAAEGAELVATTTEVVQHARSLSLLRMLTESERLYADAMTANPLGFGSVARALLTLGPAFVTTTVLDQASDALSRGTARVFSTHDLDAVINPDLRMCCTAAHHRRSGYRRRARTVDASLTRFTAWASVVGMPALSVPAPLGTELPTSIQVLAPPGREDTCAGRAGARGNPSTSRKVVMCTLADPMRIGATVSTRVKQSRRDLRCEPHSGTNELFARHVVRSRFPPHGSLKPVSFDIPNTTWRMLSWN